MPNEKPDSFQVGPFEVARNPDVRLFVEKLNRLREAIDQCRLQPGRGYDVIRSSGGTTLSIHGSGRAGGSVPALHPWKITTRTADGQPQAMVEASSQLYWTSGQFVRVNNLGEWISAPRPSDVYLRVSWASAFVFSEAKLEALADQPAPTDNSASIRLGGILKSGEVVQAVTTDIQARNACRNGKPSVYFVYARELQTSA